MSICVRVIKHKSVMKAIVVNALLCSLFTFINSSPFFLFHVSTFSAPVHQCWNLNRSLAILDKKVRIINKSYIIL